MFRGIKTKSSGRSGQSEVVGLREALLPSDEPALQGVRYRLKPVMGPQLLIDVMEMIAQCLRADTEPFGNSWSIITRRKHA